MDCLYGLLNSYVDNSEPAGLIFIGLFEKKTKLDTTAALIFTIHPQILVKSCKTENKMLALIIGTLHEPCSHQMASVHLYWHVVIVAPPSVFHQ